jgi:uncharacterized membrane protein
MTNTTSAGEAGKTDLASRRPRAWRREALAWAAVLAACLGLRGFDLGRSVYWSDEVATSLVLAGYQWGEIRPQLSGHEFRPDDVLRFQRPSSERSMGDTLRTLANFDPHHMPLYFLAARAWAGAMGSSPTAIRWLSVLGGVLVVPLFFLLAAELFTSSRTGILAAGLALVSPFHEIYAQEARPYAWLTVIVLVSSTLLLKASRKRSTRLWAFYALCVAGGMYLHLNFAFVIAAHAAWVILRARVESSAKREILDAMLPYAVATSLGLLVWIPWLVIALPHAATAVKQMTWASTPVGLGRLIAMWAFNYSAVFFDTDISIANLKGVTAGVLVAYALRAAVLVMAGIALVHLWRTANRMMAAFVTILVVVPFLAVALPDLIFGGWRSGGGSRYLLASYVGIGLATARLLERLLSTRRWLLGVALSGALATGGLFSCFLFVRADSWWSRGSAYDLPGVIRTINEANAQGTPPLIYAPFKNSLVTLAHGLASDVRMRAMEQADASDVAPVDAATVFIYFPTPRQMDALRLRFADAFQRVDGKGHLWRIASGK